MRKRRKSRRSQVVDVIWLVVTAIAATGGIAACSHYQESLRSGGVRAVIIAAAIALGAGAGILADRVTAPRRSSRRGGPNRKTRRHMRSVMFAVTGIVIVSCFFAFYMAHRLDVIIGTASAVLFGSWAWYILESRSLSRGTEARHLHDRDE